MTVDYADFLTDRAQLADSGGFEPTELPDHLFDFQHQLVEWAVRQGRAALFADCGLGKTPMELAWAEQVHRRTGKPVLLLTPLAVSFQIAAEAEKFGHDAEVSRDGSVPAAVTITNYEQIEKFDPARFGGIVCDESSALKAMDGVRRGQVTEFMRTLPYRLLGTATAAPNDYIELGTSSEALGHLGQRDMLTRFFTRSRVFDGVWGRGDEWRMKGHAAEAFWRWVASWARAIRRPSDLGYDDTRFHLPGLDVREHLVEPRTLAEGTLFDVPATGLREEREEARRTLDERCERTAALLSDAETGVAWCHLNDESASLARLIDGAVEIKGADSAEAKEEKLRAFTEGQVRVLVTKPSIGAWGLNWQHCHRMTYFPSHSYEQYYQAVRRSWRFGQTKTVEVDVVTTLGGRRVLASLREKAAQADAMFDALTRHMRDALTIERSETYETKVEVPGWAS